MPTHKCGQIFYEGTIVTNTTGTGIFAILRALGSAYARTVAKVQSVYDWDCPKRCDDRKSGLTCYRLTSIRAVKLGAFEGIPVPPGTKVEGYEVAFRWRLVVTCARDKVPNRDGSPTELAWDELDRLIQSLDLEPGEVN